MMRFVPMMFFFFFYNMPSAFVLYFATNAVLSFGETWMIKKQLARAKARAKAAEAAAPAEPGKGAAAEPAPPVTDPKAFWAREAEKKLGKKK